MAEAPRPIALPVLVAGVAREALPVPRDFDERPFRADELDILDGAPRTGREAEVGAPGAKADFRAAVPGGLGVASPGAAILVAVEEGGGGCWRTALEEGGGG